MDFFGCKPSRVLKRLANVFPFKVRKVRENLFDRGAMGELPNDDRNGNPHPANARPTTHQRRIKRNPIKVAHVWRLAGPRTIDKARRAT